MTRRYASTAVSGTRRACSHSCSDRKLSPNCRANSDWAKPRPPRTSRTRRANSSACTSRIAPTSLFPIAECFGVDGLLRVTGTPPAARRLLAVPACRRELNRTSHSSRRCQACTLCQRVSGNSTLLAHRRAFHSGPCPSRLSNPARSCNHWVSIRSLPNASFQACDLRFRQQTLRTAGKCRRSDGLCHCFHCTSMTELKGADVQQGVLVAEETRLWSCHFPPSRR